MSATTGRWSSAKGTLRYRRARQDGPIPIWESRLYQERRARDSAPRSPRDGAGSPDATLLGEKRALADRLFDLCENASRAVRQRGEDITDDLERIAELSLVVSYWDSETVPETNAEGTLERLEESRDYLAAMVLASEVARLADVPARTAGHPEKSDDG